MPRRRLRELGLSIGRHPTGPWNAITDVPGVLVGHATLVRGEGARVAGIGPVRTGVTAILPAAGDVFRERVVGGSFVLNGAGEVSGLTQVQEWGQIETPILLTNTLSVGASAEGLVRYLVARYPSIGGRHDVVIPLVGECDDSWLNDIAGGHVHAEHVVDAIEAAASGPVAEGNVGGGTGMVCCDFKGGIGTSSRVITTDEGVYVLGVLVMTNFGGLGDLRMGGIPVGAMLAPRFADLDKRRDTYGSIIAVVATDAPLATSQLNRICKRAALGIGRVGSYAAHGSGEIVLGFSTANRIPRERAVELFSLKLLIESSIDPIYQAAVECTEEAILNALCMAEDMSGVDDHFAPALPLELVSEIIRLFNDAGERGAELVMGGAGRS